MLHHPLLLEVLSAVIRCSCTIVAMRPTGSPERHLERALAERPLVVGVIEKTPGHLFEQQELAVTCVTKTPSKCPNSRLIVANIVSRSVRLLTSARTARLPAPSVCLAACSDPSFKPQMATRAPSLSNSCAAASPIPLLPPVIRIFLFTSLPIVVTPPSPRPQLLGDAPASFRVARAVARDPPTPVRIHHPRTVRFP